MNRTRRDLLRIGMAAAAFMTRLMEKLLFGIQRLDAVSFLVAPLVNVQIGPPRAETRVPIVRVFGYTIVQLDLRSFKLLLA